MDSSEFKLPLTVVLPYDNYEGSEILLDWHCTLSVNEWKCGGQLNQLLLVFQ